MSSKRDKRPRNQTSKSPASSFGQIMGEVFAEVVIEFIQKYLDEKYADYELLQPEEGKRLIRLEMTGGLPRQMDNVIALKYSSDPVALLETKWLKDGRHYPVVHRPNFEMSSTQRNMLCSRYSPPH